MSEQTSPNAVSFNSIEEVSRKADVLIEAMKWIREHRGATVVVKLGGSLMEDEIAMMHLFTDLVFMESVGIKRDAPQARQLTRMPSFSMSASY